MFIRFLRPLLQKAEGKRKERASHVHTWQPALRWQSPPPPPPPRSYTGPWLCAAMPNGGTHRPARHRPWAALRCRWSPADPPPSHRQRAGRLRQRACQRPGKRGSRRETGQRGLSREMGGERQRASWAVLQRPCYKWKGRAAEREERCGRERRARGAQPSPAEPGAVPAPSRLSHPPQPGCGRSVPRGRPSAEPGKARPSGYRGRGADPARPAGCCAASPLALWNTLPGPGAGPALVVCPAEFLLC